ncbi:MAG TPA: T9SS type A sorting domain-containing protein [Crocinitomix sp.]|nr:T9SS type A sorting domain-containing protein [Crocinitomix sp.]
MFLLKFIAKIICTMKKIILVFISIIFINSLMAQQKYSKVKIFANDNELAQIAQLGIAIDHGERKQNTWFITDLSVSEIQILQNNGFTVEIQIDDVSKFYAKRAWENYNVKQSDDDRNNCGNSTGGSNGFDPAVPANFNLGSMGGYLTYAEFLAELDEMSNAYPNLITTKAPISTFTTWEGRPIYWLKISDNPNVDENEKEVLYTAIHHAREPNSLMQTIFFMWYLLENYGTDQEVTYLVDNTEMYFVPMINPDGYVQNETTNPSGGGMHRKNKRAVGTSNPGVDLNRNYAYHWNEAGTSPDVNNDTYAGPNAFSEPETQAIKWFCENRNFEFALNAHSYSNLLLFPIGWSTTEYAADHDYFQAFSSHQVLFNGYANQKATDLYPAAGDSDDWMYADDLATKPQIFAQTPEVGSSADGFWPPASRIIPLAKENVWMNLIQAHLPHVYGYATDTDPSKIEGTNGYFHYSLQRLGLTNGPITVSIEPLAGIQTIGADNVHNLNIMDVENDSIAYTLNSNIAFGDEIKYVLKTNLGLWTRTDTIVKTYGAGNAIFSDDFTTFSNWSGSWGTTSEYFVSPTSSMTDSPNSNYSNNSQTQIQLNDMFSFENSTYAYATFYARWDIEASYDFVEFMASIDNGLSWIPLCGEYTIVGNSNQDNGQPLYEGTQNSWVFEEVDLSDYLGETNVQFKFRLVSDGFVTGDGFAFDDFSIFSDTASTVGLNNLIADDFKIYPNPTNSSITIYTTPNTLIGSIKIYNHLGQVVKFRNGISSNKIQLDVNQLDNGMYYVKLLTLNNQTIIKKFVVSK